MFKDRTLSNQQTNPLLIKFEDMSNVNIKESIFNQCQNSNLEIFNSGIAIQSDIEILNLSNSSNAKGNKHIKPVRAL